VSSQPTADVSQGNVFRVVGGARLVGEVTVPAAKNSVLELMAAALLAPGCTTLTGAPDVP
jgi:UDP-N-acetylglucosamine 1-carboxyvinyltransferase